MMKLTIIYLYLCIFLLSCQVKQDHYYWQNLKLANGIEKNALRIKREKKAIPSGYSLLYAIPFLEQRFLRDTVKNLLIRRGESKNSVDLDTMKHVETQTFYIQQKPYVIEHFKLGGGIDSGTEFYWSDELGLILYRGTYWPIYFILQSHDQYQNQKIWALVKAVDPGIKRNIYTKGMLVPELRPGFEHVIDKSYWVE